MSQRLILKKRASDMVLSDLTDIVLRGSDPEDDDQNGDGDNGDNDSSGDGANGDGSGDGDGSDSSKDDGKDDELEKARSRMKAADRRAAELERRLKEFEDKDKSEGQRLAEENNALKETVADLTEKVRKSMLQNAFLTSSDYTWHDADAALALADLSEVMDEDGEVNKKALKAALKALAESKPFLVKKQGDEGDGGGSSSGGNGASGSSTGSPKNNSNKKGLTDAELARLYPALSSRL